MTHQKSAVLTAFFTILIIILGGLSIMKGGLYVAKHEGDTMHLMQIVFRMVGGQTPHVDFMTPIGALAFWPIAMFVKAGMGIGMAVIWAQIAAAAVFLPILFWVSKTRLSPWVAAYFGMIVIVLLLALVHGEAQRSLSISMHYNRLAWAAAFVAILMAVVPPRAGLNRRFGTTVDGVIIGLMVCALAMIKMTYLVSFALPVLVALVLTKQLRALGVAAITGGAVMAVITAFGGLEFWFAYAGDLLAVATSDVRSAPGEAFTAILGAPAYIGGTLALFLAIIFLRQAQVETGGLVMLLLAPGFFYVTYQNFGNDPQWLLLVSVLLLALRPQAVDIENGFGLNVRDGIGAMAAVTFALTAPSFFNMAHSPFRHSAADVADYAPILPRGGIHSDLLSGDVRVNRVDGRIALDGQLDGLPAYEGRDAVPDFLDLELTDCTVELGLPMVMHAMALDLEEAGLAAGKSVFAADIFSSQWMFGTLVPMDQGAPWYYGGLPGLEDADYVLVPLCPTSPTVQKQILDLMTARLDAGTLSLREIRRTDLFALYEKTAP